MSAPAAETMLAALTEQRFRLATGVPCSLLRGLFAELEDPDSAARRAGLRYLPGAAGGQRARRGVRRRGGRRAGGGAACRTPAWATA